MPILKFLIHSIIFLIPSVAIGQSTFTEHIQKQQAGEGKVIIVQDSKIDDVVNNVPKKSPLIMLEHGNAIKLQAIAFKYLQVITPIKTKQWLMK